MRKHTYSLIVVAASFGLLIVLTSTPGVYAQETVVNGKKYMQSGGKLYPMNRYTWKSLDGTVHESWVTDYSKYEAPKNKEMALPPHQSLTVQPAKAPDTKGQDPASAISVRDAGSKHYITIGADVLFDFDKSELNKKAEEVMLTLGPMLKKYGNCRISIDGHTDSIGTDEYNLTLSEKRAITVKEWLLAHEFISGAISTRGLGKSSPVAPNTYNDGTDFPSGRAKNRRVEILVDTAVADSATETDSRQQ